MRFYLGERPGRAEVLGAFRELIAKEVRVSFLRLAASINEVHFSDSGVSGSWCQEDLTDDDDYDDTYWMPRSLECRQCYLAEPPAIDHRLDPGTQTIGEFAASAYLSRQYERLRTVCLAVNFTVAGSQVSYAAEIIDNANAQSPVVGPHGTIDISGDIRSGQVQDAFGSALQEVVNFIESSKPAILAQFEK